MKDLGGHEMRSGLVGVVDGEGFSASHGILGGDASGLQRGVCFTGMHGQVRI